MESSEVNNPGDSLKKFDKNPFDPEKIKPVDIVRIFYEQDIPLIPVISSKGILLGLLEKEEVVSEMSDIERVEGQKIDQFINSLLKKMTFDDVLRYLIKNKEFITINLFGEIQGRLTRLELLTAIEKGTSNKIVNKEIEQQREEQILEWMIYLILEHIPRALYAINVKGKTIFYNSYFEDIFEKQFSKELDVNFVETSLKDPDKNELFYKNTDGAETYFYNREFNLYYEKIPFSSNNKTIGFLIFQDNPQNKASELIIPSLDRKRLSLQQILSSVERMILVEEIKESKNDLNAVARQFKISKKTLISKIEKYKIELD